MKTQNYCGLRINNKIYKNYINNRIIVIYSNNNNNREVNQLV